MPKKEYWDELWNKTPLSQEEIQKYEDQYLSPELRKSIGKYCRAGQIRWLEAGCGPGYWNFLFNADERIKFSVGVDISDCLIEAQQYKKKYKLASPYFTKANILKLPFKSESFDFITSLGVIEHFKQPELPLLEMQRMLAPGGVLFLNTPNKGLWSLRTKYFPIDEYEDYYRPEELKDMAEQCGFDVLEYYAKGLSNSVMTVLYNIYDYNQRSLLSRGYHFGLSYVKKALKYFDPWLDHRYGFYSIVIARKK